MCAHNNDLLVAKQISQHFPLRSTLFRSAQNQKLTAVEDVSFVVPRGKTLGLVGESGCGKTTIGRIALGLLEPSVGKIVFEGREVGARQDVEWRKRRQQMQLVHQDPYAALDRRLKIGAQVAEPLEIHRICDTQEDRYKRALALMARVGLQPEHFDRYPHEISGGQRQRAVLARALILNPSLVVCDESVSALDVSVQAQVINLLLDLQEALGLSYLFISHDLRVVRQVSHEVAVMYLGSFVETGPPELVLKEPIHPYSQALVGSMPQISLEKRANRTRLCGELPNLLDRPQGCTFHPRCPIATDICKKRRPTLRSFAGGRKVACHLVEGVEDVV